MLNMKMYSITYHTVFVRMMLCVCENVILSGHLEM